MSIFNNLDKFLERKFIGENESEKVEKSEKNKNEEASAIDRAHRMLQMPEEIDKLQENLKKIFKEISIRLDDKKHELEDSNNRIKVLEKEVAALKKRQEEQRILN